MLADDDDDGDDDDDDDGRVRREERCGIVFHYIVGGSFEEATDLD